MPVMSFSIPKPHKAVILGPYLHPPSFFTYPGILGPRKQAGVGDNNIFQLGRRKAEKSQESVVLLYTGPSGCSPPVSELDPCPPEEPMGKYNEVLKGLFAFEPRCELSLSQAPGFIPALCRSLFCLTWSSYSPSAPQLPEARVELMGNQTYQEAFSPSLASLGVEGRS